MTSIRIVSACFSLALLAPSLAKAEEPATTPLTAARERVVKGGQLFAQAEKKHDRELYEAAYLQFAQAYAIFPDFRVLWNLGMSEIRTDRFVEGLAHLRAFDAHEHVLTQPTHPLHAKLTELLREGNAATGHLAIDAPNGAIVTIDSKSLPNHAPITDLVDVLPGDHAVTAQLGERNAKLVVNAAAGSTTNVHLGFAPDAPPPVAPAPVVPTQATSIAPANGEQPPPGGVSTTGTVVRWSLTGVGIVGLGLGAAFAASSHSKGDDVDAFRATTPQPCVSQSSATCSRYQSLIDDQNNATTASRVFYVVGAVSAVGAVAAWIWWPRSQERSGVSWIVPSVSPGAATVQVGGRF